ncbi:mechanosensitive ion channel family protein [Mesorhizobium australicum]|uniref:Small-conductance mechanosensitive channel n=1 Tax=Mesorhizobium australicum TaxID=536018 RepID=A0A1X7P9N7_9HYPH|nr:mechanosensitive ion channel family protein [Mesorhizobium australicum]SMH46917.1 Small-conductance mechanosensitive channel [Mesorhizobium australicum]
MNTDPFHKLAALLIALLMAVALVAPSSAQGPVPEIVATQQTVIQDLSRKAEEIEKRIEANANDDARLADLRLELDALNKDILKAGVAFRPRLSEINARLESLGSPPAEGQPPEAEMVTTERQALLSEKSQINVLIGDAEATSLRVNRLMEQVSQMRRDLFANTLSKRYEIDYALLGEVAEDFSDELSRLYMTVSSWLKFVVQYKLSSVLTAALFALAGALVLRIGGGRLFGRLIYADPTDPDPPYISRLSVAFWSTFLRSAAIAVFFLSTWFFFDYFDVLRGDIGAMLRALFIVLALILFVNRLSHAVLSPKLPNWRLLEIEPRPARLLVWLITAMSIATGADYLFSEIFRIRGAALALTVGESLLATVIVGILLILIATVRPFADAEGRPKAWPMVLRIAFYIVGAATVLAALLGYIGMAKFVSQQIVVTGAILAMMYIGVLSGRALSEEGAFAGTALGRRLGERWRIEEATFDQLGLASSILINIFVLFVGLPLILLQWGFQWGDIRAWAYSIATEIRVGTVSFSLIGIFTGILIFAIGFFATRWFQGWLDDSVMTRGRVDAGVRNSIRTAVGYAGVALAGLIGISAAGIDLSNLALIAGALSLGIGFGLQNVVSNFVSGLILLAERPFKVGDWVVAGAVQGTVKKISVRATEIETFQRQTVIMPNSELINAAVGNWTHRNKLGRIEIGIGVAYGSDARKVHALLLEIASAHPMVLRNPEPSVAFLRFGESSLDFEIRVFLSDVTNGVKVQNEIRFAILEAFAEHSVEIPYPHRTLIIGQDDLARATVPPDGLSAPAEEGPRPAEVAAKPSSWRRRRRSPSPDLNADVDDET